MALRDDLLAALRGSLSRDDRVVVLHSSLPMLAPPAGFGKWDALYALRQLVDAGLTVALPAFTFSSCGGRVFNPVASKSEVGLLADWAGELEGFSRTGHPIYSFVVGGRQADRIHRCLSATTFGDDSPFAVFEAENARIVMLGCGWTFCTQFHRYEEKAAVPYRLFKTFDCRRDAGAGVEPAPATMFVRDLDIDADNDFTPVVRRLDEADAIRRLPLWGGEVESASCRDIADAMTAVLAADPLAVVADRAAVAARMARVSSRRRQPPYRVAVLGSANVALVEKAAGEALAELMPDRTVETFSVPYGQLHQQVLAPHSDLNRLAADAAFFLDRPEDLVAQPFLELADPAMLADAVGRYGEAIRAYRKAHSGPVVVARFAAFRRATQGQAWQADLLSDLNRRLDECLAGEDVICLDPQTVAAGFAGPALDDRLWFLGRFPYSEPFSRALAQSLAAKLLAASGRTARLVVLDLDNTLWGGVLGEDGLAGLALGGDYPGNAFKAFQQLLKTVADAGVALAVCSKNDEAQALAAMAQHPEMVLRPDMLTAHRINWQPKPGNLAAIARELNLGLANVLFIDDNPAERERMRRELPDVKVLELPQDPAEYAQSLLNCPWLEVLAVTAEDRGRVEKYRARQAVEASRTAFADMDEFYASLGTRVTLAPLDDGNAVRAVQLLAKTNQFNATTRRHDRSALEGLIREGADVIVIGAEDRYSGFENIGVLVVRWNWPDAGCATIDSYLLSCRVLGRGLETGLIHWLKSVARARGMRTLAGEIIETDRNEPVRDVYRQAGFEPGPAPGLWLATLDGADCLPAWLSVNDLVTKGR